MVSILSHSSLRSVGADHLEVAHAEPEVPQESQWHLFNDFSVKQIPPAEALTFNTRWKMPSMLVYQLKTANNQLDTDWVKYIDTSVLHIDFKYALPPELIETFRLTDPDSDPTLKSTLTEFSTQKQSDPVPTASSRSIPSSCSPGSQKWR